MDEDDIKCQWTGPVRFLDLARELRNMVYCELLCIPVASSSSELMHKTCCYPAILRTNKQIEVEGKEILYGENAREIVIHCTNTHKQKCRKKSVVMNNVGENYVRWDRATKLHTWALLWEVDKQIAMFKKVRVHLTLDNSVVSRFETRTERFKGVCVAVNQHLYHIVSNLANSLGLKAVEVIVDASEFRTPDDMSASTAESMLQRAPWPLTFLGERRSFRLTGVPSNVERYITSNLETIPILQSGSLFSAGNHAIAECKKIQKCMKIFEHQVSFEHEGLARCAAIWRYPARLLHGHSTFIDHSFVDGLAQGVRDMEAYLDDPGVVELNRRWTEWMSSRQTRGCRNAAVEGKLR